jgi:catechol 2,3-dioxygenase-like lactoylglutathione lyase family enzyme
MPDKEALARHKPRRTGKLVPLINITKDSTRRQTKKFPQLPIRVKEKDRMLGHLGVNVSDLARAKAYYDQLMPLLGFESYLTATDQFAYRRLGGKPGTYLFFYPALQQGDYSRHRTGLQHLAFIVPSRQAVHAVYAKVQELGSAVIHAPQEFPQYHSGYYAVFWQGPDGFMLEAVCHRQAG